MTSTPEARTQIILVVDDEEPLLFALAHTLRREGYQVLTAGRGDDALRIARDRRPDLVILDLMLPGIDGLEVCRLLRRGSTAPIIMLTALGGESDRVIGLDTGADDYVVKPFGMQELLARVRAHIRRTTAPGPAIAGGIRTGGLMIDADRHEARLGSRLLRLKPKEFQLLLFFARNAGRVLTREQILDEVWGRDYYGSPRTIDVHIRWLRQKLDGGADTPRIVTVRGTGYLFEG